MLLTRRHLLLLPVPAVLGATTTRLLATAQGLDQFALGGPPCTVDAAPTPAVARDATYKPGSPLRASLVDSGTPAGSPLTFTGTVNGVTCGRVAGARVDVWHADPRGEFDLKGFALRGHQVTDAQGQFRFMTVMPGKPAGRAPFLGVHVSVKGKADFWTALFFPEVPENATDRRFRPELVAKLVPEGRARRAHFDVLLDI